MDILTISGLTKKFGDKEVLRGLDLAVAEGSIFGFVGKNGAGKTTTMKAVLGLLKVDSGEISVCGKKVCYGQTETNKYIGYLPDVPEYYSFMNAREYLDLCGNCFMLDKKDIASRREELLELVGLSKENHRIRGYSRGMKQRLGIAQALMCRPRLLICDEPTSALDPIGRKEILDILYSAKDRTTVLFSTHILSDIDRICTDIAFLNDGKIALQGKAAQLKSVHKSKFFTVCTTDPKDAFRVAAEFNASTPPENGVINLAGDENRMFEVLAYLSSNKIPVKKIEKVEPTVENLFMEVIK